jgi:hypothetical protein
MATNYNKHELKKSNWKSQKTSYGCEIHHIDSEIRQIWVYAVN